MCDFVAITVDIAIVASAIRVIMTQVTVTSPV
jgi:hypothetical protein